MIHKPNVKSNAQILTRRTTLEDYMDRLTICIKRKCMKKRKKLLKAVVFAYLIEKKRDKQAYTACLSPLSDGYGKDVLVSL